MISSSVEDGAVVNLCGETVFSEFLILTTDLLAIRQCLCDHFDTIWTILQHLHDEDLGEDVRLLGGVAVVAHGQHCVILIKREKFAEVKAEQSGEVTCPVGKLQTLFRISVAKFERLKAVSWTGEAAIARGIRGLRHQIAARGLNTTMSVSIFALWLNLVSTFGIRMTTQFGDGLHQGE